MNTSSGSTTHNTPEPLPACPIRGHDHELVHVRDHYQKVSNMKATTWECPSGNYRWFCIESRTPAELHAIRMTIKRPRWGWKD